jgi:predicted component of type VI protein secretion system
MDVHAASSQIGTPVPVRSTAPAETPPPARPAAGEERLTDVTLEQDRDSGLLVVSVVDADTKEILVQVPPASVRATIAGLLEIVRQRELQSWQA